MPNENDPRKMPVDAPKANGDELRVIGVPRRRVDARAKVTGQTRFADDIFLPRMAHCKLLRSPHPHARIRKIDASLSPSARTSKPCVSTACGTSEIQSLPSSRARS